VFVPPIGERRNTNASDDTRRSNGKPIGKPIAHNLLAIPFPYTEADADWWLDRCEQSIGSPMTNFALRTPSGYLIGAIGVVGALSTDAHSAELGYWLAQSYRGRGLMPRVIRTFSDYAFQELP
jgi:RimJ/RimL family protein N-acetyltransferase